MNTLEEQQMKNTKNSLPNEIIEDIFTRLPVKSILRFKSVSKPWLFLISNPLFVNLHFTRTNTSQHSTALFLVANEPSTGKRHFLSAAYNGGQVTHITTSRILPSIVKETIEVEHLNGLVSGNGFSAINQVYIINPTTLNFYKLTSPSVRTIHVKALHIFYFFGFDELRNEHKVLNIRMLAS